MTWFAMSDPSISTCHHVCLQTDGATLDTADHGRLCHSMSSAKQERGTYSGDEQGLHWAAGEVAFDLHLRPLIRVWAALFLAQPDCAAERHRLVWLSVCPEQLSWQLQADGDSGWCWDHLSFLELRQLSSMSLRPDGQHSWASEKYRQVLLWR